MSAGSGRFEDRLAVSVTLTIAGTAHAFAGGAVPHVELVLESHGFSGTVELLVQDDVDQGGGFEDALLDAFLGADLVTVKVAVARVFHEPETPDSLVPLEVEGLVTHKSMEELLLRRSGDQPILVRRYRVGIADPARVLWTQHFPCELYTEQSPQAIIDTHAGEHIALRWDWAELSKAAPQWFVHLPTEHGASFYDFVVWVVDVRGGVLTYDYAEQEYAITALVDASGQAQPLHGDDVHTAEIVVPPTPRHVVVVTDSYVNGTRTETIEQDQAVTGVQHARLMRTPIAQDVDDMVKLQRTRLRRPKYEAELGFRRMPIADVVPGTTLTLSAANRWSEGSALVTPTWRVRELRLCATALSGALDHDHQEASTGYGVELRARLVQSDDPRVFLPAYRAPCYPGYVEGKIVSEKGEDGEKTFHNFTNATTSLEEYTVKVPLWADQQVKAPFEPAQGSGNAFLPSYRDERVLLAMELESSRIERLLEWREGAALSMDVQGEQILLGKSVTSYTSINHVYEDEQPVFNLARTHVDDTSLVRLSEGTMLLQVQELEGGQAASGTLVCTLEQSKTGGVTIKVVNTDASITQTVSMNGTTLTLEVAGESEKSFITLADAKITIETKDLVIKARNTIEQKAESTATYESKEKTTIESTTAAVAITAKTELKGTANDVTLAATTAASMKGTTATVEGSQSLTLTGTSQAKLSGAMVTVNGSSSLTADSSGMATVGGSMTTIKGSLIKAG